MTNFLIGLISLLHFYIMFMEMFLWTKERTLKIFNMSREQAETSKALAANMGLYNGFLAFGLLYGIIQNNYEFKLFFLVCVFIAGLYGGITATKRIIFVQSAPALLTIFLLLLS
ncbi:MAG: DUF1304 domain-containing protein [Oligoflexia bacterium]|nr:DUF1304 domain-containing protein [Oligoflexia bacterium]